LVNLDCVRLIEGGILVPLAHTAPRQKKAFSIVGPSVWDSISSDLRSLPQDLSSSFYRLLKTFRFDRAWTENTFE